MENETPVTSKHPPHARTRTAAMVGDLKESRQSSRVVTLLSQTSTHLISCTHKRHGTAL